MGEILNKLLELGERKFEQINGHVTNDERLILAYGLSATCPEKTPKEWLDVLNENV